MTDLSKTIEPKSDQLNADDLIAGPKTLKITAVRVVSGDQPVLVEYEGGEGRPYKPCKSMRRLLISAWGSNGENYVGKQITVFNDGSVRWAGTEVGGIRISHMSDIEKPLRFMLTISRGKRAPYTVEVLQTAPLKKLTDKELKAFTNELEIVEEMADLKKIGARIKANGYDADGSKVLTDLYRKASARIREASTK